MNEAQNESALVLVEAEGNSIHAPPVRGLLEGFAADGLLCVKSAGGEEFLCDWLETGVPLAPPLAHGDAVLFMPTGSSGQGLVLGRIARYKPDALPRVLAFESSESLTLKCGAASIDLRADGKVMVRGEDVLLRAKGTQRIRAGTVSIN